MRPDAVGLGGFDSHTLPPLSFPMRHVPAHRRLHFARTALTSAALVGLTIVPLSVGQAQKADSARVGARRTPPPAVPDTESNADADELPRVTDDERTQPRVPVELPRVDEDERRADRGAVSRELYGDPREEAAHAVPAGDLEAQHAAALKLRDYRSELNDALRGLDALKLQLDERKKLAATLRPEAPAELKKGLDTRVETLDTFVATLTRPSGKPFWSEGPRLAEHRGSRHYGRLLHVRQTLLEQLCYLSSRLESFLRNLGDEFVDRVSEPAGNVRVDLAEWPWCVLAHAADGGHGALGAEGRAAGAHGVQHTAQAEQVRPMIHPLTAGLLGRHILRRCLPPFPAAWSARHRPREPGRNR